MFRISSFRNIGKYNFSSIAATWNHSHNSQNLSFTRNGCDGTSKTCIEIDSPVSKDTIDVARMLKELNSMNDPNNEIIENVLYSPRNILYTNDDNIHNTTLSIYDMMSEVEENIKVMDISVVGESYTNLIYKHNPFYNYWKKEYRHVFNELRYCEPETYAEYFIDEIKKGVHRFVFKSKVFERKDEIEVRESLMNAYEIVRQTYPIKSFKLSEAHCYDHSECIDAIPTYNGLVNSLPRTIIVTDSKGYKQFVKQLKENYDLNIVKKLMCIDHQRGLHDYHEYNVITYDSNHIPKINSTTFLPYSYI